MRFSLRRAIVPDREEVEELLDEHDAPGPDVERSLRDLRRINRFLGGRRTWRRLTKLTARSSPARAILEIGTGTSDLLESTAEIPLRIGLDLKIDHLLYGHKIGDRSVARVVADARHLPFRDGAIDLAGSSHFFHHFTLDDNELILRECLRVCRLGAFVTDTARHRLPWLFVKWIGLLGIVGRITKFDAPASVARSYTKPEIRLFAARFEGLTATVRSCFPFRFCLIIQRNGRDHG